MWKVLTNFGMFFALRESSRVPPMYMEGLAEQINTFISDQRLITGISCENTYSRAKFMCKYGAKMKVELTSSGRRSGSRGRARGRNFLNWSSASAQGMTISIRVT